MTASRMLAAASVGIKISFGGVFISCWDAWAVSTESGTAYGAGKIVCVWNKSPGVQLRFVVASQVLPLRSESLCPILFIERTNAIRM